MKLCKIWLFCGILSHYQQPGEVLGQLLGECHFLWNFKCSRATGRLNEMTRVIYSKAVCVIGHIHSCIITYVVLWFNMLLQVFTVVLIESVYVFLYELLKTKWHQGELLPWWLFPSRCCFLILVWALLLNLNIDQRDIYWQGKEGNVQLKGAVCLLLYLATLASNNLGGTLLQVRKMSCEVVSCSFLIV